ncbi:unnamed protein product [Trichobilharzia regenti]|nr:unnamed protein product [Trichobilharzia regenti]
MCAYHHYLQHPESEPLYTYGKVLIVQELKLHRSLICSNCQVQLSTVKHMTTRCGNSTWCYSSFFYSLYCQMISSSRLFILSVLCKVCERSFFTVLTPDNWFNGQSTSSRKRKQEEKEYNTGDYSETDYQSSSTSLLTCGEEFSRFCLSHAFQHIDRGNLLQSCNLSVRIIDITNSVKCLSPINLMSYSAALLFSLYECRNLLFYFRKYYGSSFHLFKNAKNHFKNLFVDALFNL